MLGGTVVLGESAPPPFSTQLVTSLVASNHDRPNHAPRWRVLRRAGEPLVAEYFDVPATTARLVNLHATVGRVIAVGTTATRAWSTA